ncbi:hypothetical protein D2E26_0002 [Bifidobacterium dolichotidis]|uniref:Colicin transporter n=1 Tax=Bifidobacterium dolichotidis TaxID=2306976 RepID=A0A430FRE2_9BIFI|nr:hypothetical protein [Bifidobacterium dolichotidis]RSX55439.1 hypothetical protein D2E26_0002 [Bifidobacterium dolichotidis]
MFDEKQLVEAKEDDDSLDEAEVDAEDHQQKHAWKTIIAVIAVVLLVVAVSCGFIVWNNARIYRDDMFRTAYNTCQNQADKVPASEEELSAALKKARHTADTLSATDVADPNTLSDLQDAISSGASVKRAPSCNVDASAETLIETARLIDTSMDNAHNAANALQYSTKAALASQKELDLLHNK